MEESDETEYRANETSAPGDRRRQSTRKGVESLFNLLPGLLPRLCEVAVDGQHGSRRSLQRRAPDDVSTFRLWLRDMADAQHEAHK